MVMYLVLINKKQRGGLGGTRGGPIYIQGRESRAWLGLAWLSLAGLVAVPSTWQREIESRA